MLITPLRSGAFRADTSQDTHAHQYPEQVLCQADRRLRRGDRPIRLAPLDAIEKETLKPLECLDNRLTKLAIVRRNLKGGIDKHATLAFAVTKRTAEDVVEK